MKLWVFVFPPLAPFSYVGMWYIGVLFRYSCNRLLVASGTISTFCDQLPPYARGCVVAVLSLLSIFHSLPDSSMHLTTFLLGYHIFSRMLLALFLMFSLPLLGAGSPPSLVAFLIILLQSELLKFLCNLVESLFVPVSLSIVRSFIAGPGILCKYVSVVHQFGSYIPLLFSIVVFHRTIRVC